MRGFLVRAGLLGIVAALLPACGGETKILVTSLGAVFVISASGGQGTNGDGGNGSWIGLWNNQTAGDLKVLSRGRVNATVTVPALQPALGINPLIVNADATLTPAPLGDVNATILGADAVNPATGLWVKPGVTLTILPNYDADDFDANGNAIGTFEQAYVTFSDGVFIEGSVRSGRMDLLAQSDGLSNSAAHLEIRADSIVIGAGGRVDTRGTSNVAGVTGGNGGAQRLIANDGMFVNAGTLTSAGGSDDNGGTGATLYASSSDGGTFNSGTLDSSGGTGTAGSGGDANNILLEGYGWSGVHNNGTLRSRGGDGTTGGGSGNEIRLYTDFIGACTNAGLMDANGGNATDNGNGGSGGRNDFEANSGSVRLAGTIRSRGGNGGPNGGDGGSGNFFSVLADGTSGAVFNNMVPEGIFIGADIDTGGGNGENGGNAGSVDVECRAGGLGRPIGITLVGYVRLIVDGGRGSVNGGNGGDGSDNYFYIDSVFDSDEGLTYAGQIYNEVPFFARGGVGATGDGGDGGYHYHYVDASGVDSGPSRGIVNRAGMDLSGGNGGANGGSGNGFDFYYYPSNTFGSEVGIDSEGMIDVKGGVGTTGDGGAGGSMVIEQGDSAQNGGVLPSGVNVSGSLVLRGGGGGFSGGSSGQLDIDADFWVSISGTVDMRGGNGTNGMGGSSSGFTIDIDNISTSVAIDEVGIDFEGDLLGQGGSGASLGGLGVVTTWNSNGHATFNGTYNGGGGSAGSGGGAGPWTISAETHVRIFGSVGLAGGSSTNNPGGDGDGITVNSAKEFRAAASFNGRGGSSTLFAGGRGGDFFFWFTEGPNLSGSSMDVRGGSGTAPGLDGAINLNGTTLANPTASF